MADRPDEAETDARAYARHARDMQSGLGNLARWALWLESELTARTAEQPKAAELELVEAVLAELSLPVLGERPRSDAAVAWRDKVQASLKAIRAALAKARGCCPGTDEQRDRNREANLDDFCDRGGEGG